MGMDSCLRAMGKPRGPQVPHSFRKKRRRPSMRRRAVSVVRNFTAFRPSMKRTGTSAPYRAASAGSASTFTSVSWCGNSPLSRSQSDRRSAQRWHPGLLYNSRRSGRLVIAMAGEPYHALLGLSTRPTHPTGQAGRAHRFLLTCFRWKAIYRPSSSLCDMPPAVITALRLLVRYGDGRIETASGQ